MQVFHQINKICSHDTGLCSRRNLENALDIGPPAQKICLPVAKCNNNVGYYFDHGCYLLIQVTRDASSA